MRTLLFALPALLCLFGSALPAQSDSSHVALHEVLVSGLRETKARETTLNISALNAPEITRSGALTLCNALAQIPGISQLSTGGAIAKPVIRGLYGNRILTLIASLKFDNQQWQDEHGLGLSDVGVDRVEVIKGPASILYGSEAVGGVINVIAEQPKEGTGGHLHLGYDANARGLRGDASFGSRNARRWWLVNAGAESYADYSAGGGKRVLNSRFDGYYWKGALAFTRPNFQSVNSYQGSLNRFGFILEDLTDFFTPDNRGSRSFEGPHHAVLLNLLSSENTWWKPKGALKFNAGFQSNLRLEDEGGGAISLNMHLISVPYTLQWIHQLSARNEFIISNFGVFENNTNYGARIIVPDADMLEEGLSAFFKHLSGRWVFEGGLGIQDKYIKTFETRGLNTPDKDLRPFERNRASGNVLLGLGWNPDTHWNLKANLSSGYRAPNLAELSSNGLHEGIFHYEIGRPDLKNEQNLNAELNISHRSRLLEAGVAAFVNQFRNYIYLAPTAEDFFGFPVYRYLQSGAKLWGGEASAGIIMQAIRWDNTLAYLRGAREDGANLPFIAPTRWTSKISWHGNFTEKLDHAWAYIETVYNAAQNRTATDETTTPAYWLLHAGIGTDMAFGKHRITLMIVGKNLLDKHYFDHLSRLKDFGIYDKGRTVGISLQMPLGRHT